MKAAAAIALAALTLGILAALPGRAEEAKAVFQNGDLVVYRVVEDADPLVAIPVSNGKVAFPMVGELPAEGRSAVQLAADLKAALEVELYHTATVMLGRVAKEEIPRPELAILRPGLHLMAGKTIGVEGAMCFLTRRASQKSIFLAVGKDGTVAIPGSDKRIPALGQATGVVEKLIRDEFILQGNAPIKVEVAPLSLRWIRIKKLGPVPEEFAGKAIYYLVLEDGSPPIHLKISPKGDIEVPLIGPVNISGRPMNDVANEIEAALKKEYYAKPSPILWKGPAEPSIDCHDPAVKLDLGEGDWFYLMARDQGGDMAVHTAVLKVGKDRKVKLPGVKDRLDLNGLSLAEAVNRARDHIFKATGRKLLLQIFPSKKEWQPDEPLPESIPEGGNFPPERVSPPKPAPAPKKPEDVAPPTAAEDPIQPGDTLVFRPANPFGRMSFLEVDEGGRAYLPWLGVRKVAGKTAWELAQAIEPEIADRRKLVAIPQIQIIRHPAGEPFPSIRPNPHHFLGIKSPPMPPPSPPVPFTDPDSGKTLPMHRGPQPFRGDQS